MKRVLVVQHAWEDPPGTLGEIMQEQGILFDTVKVEEGDALPGLTGYDAFVILGGPQHAADDHVHLYLAQEKDLIRQAVAQDIPLLGVCLGGQLLAHTMGAPLQRDAMIEIGFYEAYLTAEGQHDPLFQGLPATQQVFHWHADTFEVPVGGVLLATGDNASKQAFRLGRRAYGLQYHIELTPDMFDTWIHFHPHRQDAIETLGLERYTKIEQERSVRYPVYREHMGILFKNFLSIGELCS